MAIPTIIGLVVFALLMRWAFWARSFRWNHLATHYPGSDSDPTHDVRHWQSGVLVGLGGYDAMTGIMTAGVNRTGVVLSIVPPFSLMYRPMLIPFDEIRGWQATWFLDAESVELEFRSAPDIKMIVPADLAEWMQANAGYRMTLRRDRPPQGNAGRGWYAFKMVHLFGMGLMATAALVMLVWQKVSL